MTLDACLFAVRTRDPNAGASIGRRLDRLATFYEPLGAGEPVAREIAGLGLVTGAIDFGQRRPGADEVMVFGGELPATLRSATALREAADSQLRAIPVALTALAADDSGGSLITGPVAPAALYEASSPDTTAWSTHAVAAAYLAHGAARVDPRSLPTFVAAQFADGGHSLVDGVRALPPATRVIIGEGAVEERSYWPAPERWALCDPAAAQVEAERALLASLGGALESSRRPVLGLTGGVDSRVAAVALRELGIAFETMTFGEPEWSDVREGERVADMLGLPHHFEPVELWDDEEALRRVRAEVRWSEGAIHLGFGRVTFPEAMDAWVTGAGAETGRAFYHREVSGDDEHAGPGELRDAMDRALEPNLRGARPDVVELVRGQVAEWLVAAESAGARGWRCLDLLYAEQRLQRWGWAMQPRGTAPMVFAFAHPALQRALISLPVAERRSDAFHRRFLERHCPEAAIGRRRQRSNARALAGLAAQALRRGSRGAPARSLLAPHWPARQRFHSWIADELLTSPLLAEALGTGWRDRVRSGFANGDPELEALALWASAPVALEDALTELNAVVI